MVRFSAVTTSPTRIDLVGEEARASVRRLPGGIYRILVYSKESDADKRSLTTVLGEPEPIAVQRTGEILELEGLRIATDPFSWEWEGVEGELASPTEIHLPLPPERRHYGLGERVGFLDKTGRRWTNWTTDDWRHTPEADPLYQAHPFVILAAQDHACGLFLDETWKTTFDLGATDAEIASITTEGPTLDIYLIPGPRLRDVVGHYTRLTGRPQMPPLWALGFHQCRYSYETEAEVREIVQQFKAHDIPLDVVWLDIDYMDDDYKVFTFSPERFPDPKQLTADLAAQGVRTVAIVDPGVKKESGYSIYDQGRELDAFIKRPDGNELEGHVWPKPAVWPDFSRADVRQWWADNHRFYLDRGVCGIWNDMNEPSAHKILGLDPDAKHTGTLPIDSVQAEGSHAELHNVYGYQMCQATHAGLEELDPEHRTFLLTRSGYAGIQKYAWVWTGDNHSWWEHLEMSIPMLANLGLSGVSFCGADIGGFGGNGSAELLARWTWLGVFYPFMRNHSYQGTRPQEPWAFDEATLASVRQAIRFRYRLLPTIYTLAREAVETGVPLLRPCTLEFPDDLDAARVHDQFMFGPHLLVSPICRPQQTYRLAYVPRGSWQEFWSGNRVIGEGRIVARAGLDSIPILQRAGTAVPLAPAAMHTTDAWWEDLTWRIVLGPTIRGRVYEDAGDGQDSGTTSELHGVFDGHRLALSFDDRSTQPRKRQQIELLGMPQPQSVSSEHTYEGGVLTATVPANDQLIIEW